MDGFAGFKTAAAEQMPDAVAVMDPLHAVRLAGDALDRCLRRVQFAIHGHRGLKERPPLQVAPHAAHRRGLLTDKQINRINALFAPRSTATLTSRSRRPGVSTSAWSRPIGTRIGARASELMVKLIDSISSGVPNALVEVITLGRTLKEARRRLARLLRQTRHIERTACPRRSRDDLNTSAAAALGFRNLTNYIARSLLETGGFRPQLHPRFG